ncbi:unnamed protein product, partial [marine sediment metagenome]
DEEGQPVAAHIPGLPEGAAITEGEVNIDLIPTHKLIWDFRIGDLRKLGWIIQCDRKSAEWVRDRYGEEAYKKLSGKFGGTRTDGETEFEVNILDSLNSVLYEGVGDKQRVVTPTMRSNDDVQLDADKMIDYYEYWHKPTKSNPTGTFGIMLADQIMEYTPYPIDSYPHGELPYIPANPISVQGSTMGGVVRISQARPIQREINRLNSQIDENCDVMGNAIIMVQRGAKVRHSTLDNGAGNLLEYDGKGEFRP